MIYASLWSFSYFTFTQNQLLTNDTREYVCTQNMGFTQMLTLMQVCRLRNIPLCRHCTTDCTKLSHVSRNTLYPFSTIREGAGISLVSWPWLSHWVSLIKGRKRHLQSTMVNHGWLTMVDHGRKSSIDNHGWPWFGKAFLNTMVNHGQP